MTRRIKRGKKQYSSIKVSILNCCDQGTKYRYLRIYWYLDFTEIYEISENIGGYFDKNIGNAKINKNTLKFMEILC